MTPALCYYKPTLYKGSSGDPNCFFEAYDKKGYKKQKITIPNEKVDIIIHSNLHYAGASYLFANILVKDLYVLNFKDKQMLYLLNNHSLSTFQVEPGDWNSLFDIIVQEHNNLFMISESIIKDYFDELDKIIDKDIVTIWNSKVAERQTTWNKAFLVRLFSSDKIVDIINSVEKSTICKNSFVHKCLYASCMNFTKKIAQELEWEGVEQNDLRLKRLCKNLAIIHNYMGGHGNPLIFEKIMAGKQILSDI